MKFSYVVLRDVYIPGVRASGALAAGDPAAGGPAKGGLVVGGRPRCGPEAPPVSA